MPATGKTPIQFYRSTTSGNVPSAANLSPGELALNIADNDMTMYFENASGVVKRFFNNPAELKYPTADGTSGQGVKTDGSKTLSFGSLASAAITNNTRQAVTSSATTTIDLSSGQVIDLTMAANITTLSFTNVPASGTPVLVQIVVRNASSGTAYTIAWPNSVYWSGQYSATTISTVQTAPTLASGANGVTTIALLTTDGGTKWRGWVEGTIPGGSQLGLYTWGSNANGALGQNNTFGVSFVLGRSSPVQVGALTNWASTAAQGGDFCVATKTDGTLWGWGSASQGRLGLGSTTPNDNSSPIQIGSLTNWKTASTASGWCVAIKTDGTLWSWGYGQAGRLGQNDTVSRSSPVQIGASTNWSSVSSTSDGAVLIKTDGTLWVWGGNFYGQNGLNDRVARSSPVQVGALTDWKTAGISTSCMAVKTDGTLWTWGRNANGELGHNDLVNRSSPVQVGALTTWATVINGYFSCFALKTDGTLWAWGRNNNGQLGHNDLVNRSSPVQVGALTTWATIFRGSTTSVAALKTDGTLWMWGNNALGKLGQNDETHRSSPVQVGALTNWALGGSLGGPTAMLAGTIVNPG